MRVGQSGLTNLITLLTGQIRREPEKRFVPYPAPPHEVSRDRTLRYPRAGALAADAGVRPRKGSARPRHCQFKPLPWTQVVVDRSSDAYFEMPLPTTMHSLLMNAQPTS
jgi:hypothetical protein